MKKALRLLISALAMPLAGMAAAPLNLLLITADDLNGNTPGWMGDRHGATPALDRFAATAHRFVNCHLTVSICQPSRSAFMTGLVPHRNGALGFDPIKPGTATLVTLLRARGYYACVMNKHPHMKPDAEFPWDLRLDGSGKTPALWDEQMRQAMDAAAAARKPFFINANITDPHRPFPSAAEAGGPANGSAQPAARRGARPNAAAPSAPARVYTAGEVAVPSFLEDLPAVRGEIAQYYTAVARMDESFRRILGAIEARGHGGDTVVVFLGDNGMSFPFSKATVYRNGTHEPVLLRWPGMGEPQRREEWVSSVDLLPTVLEALDVPAPANLDGRSWLPLLRGEKQLGRDFVVTHVNTVSSGRSFAQRCIRTKDFALMFHAWPDGAPRFRVEAMSGASFGALAEAAKSDPRIAARVAQFQTGETLMFFDLRADPDERANVIREPRYGPPVVRLEKLLLAHMERTSDPQTAACRAAFARLHSPLPPQPKPRAALPDRAALGLRRGVDFFRREVAVHGTYLWQCSEDLSKREGEGVASATRGWVQPPGTPSVGMAFLTAYEATGDRFYLDAAVETARGLMRGQLLSGGWTYSIEFDLAQRKKIAYRDGGGTAGRNVTTLDDDTTQAALRFLMRIDQALTFQDARIHEAVQYALESLLKAQYPNGAWPQGYDRFPEPGKHPVQKAAYPESWPRAWPGDGRYWLRYTLNDNALLTTIETVFEASRIYGQRAQAAEWANLAARCRAAAEKAGDFLLLAQMPEPQPAWAQQYDFEMHPAWARKFEPPAVTGGESQGVLRTLLELYRETGQTKYMEPIPRALAYLRRSRLPNGGLARFYELQTNKPLYFTSDYQLTYDGRDAPTHYAFEVPDATQAIERELDRLMDTRSDPAALQGRKKPARVNPPGIAEVEAVLEAQDDRGRWIEGGGLRYHRPKDPAIRVIRSQTFSRNVEILSRYLRSERIGVGHDDPLNGKANLGS